MKRLILIAALALGLTLLAVAEGAIPQPIYFWGTVVMPIKGGPGQTTALPEVIRPSGIEMSADGSWYLEHLHWTGWGSSVAHATGDGNASSDIPNVAQGKRIKRPAQVALSNPGLFQGHEVYRCFTLTVPSLPRTDQHLCLTREGASWYLAPQSPATTTTTQATTTTTTTSPTPADASTAWKRAAARVSYPVYEPAETAGVALKRVGVYPCTVTGGKPYAAAVYTNGTGRASFSLSETLPTGCSNPGEAKSVGTVDVNGAKVQLRVFYGENCSTDCTLADGFTNGWLLYLQPPVTTKTTIEVEASHMTLAQILKVIRSLHVVQH